jgi:hypothetical protein
MRGNALSGTSAGRSKASRPLIVSMHGGPFTDAGIGRLFKKLAPDANMPGLRSSFRDRAGETTTHLRDVIEHAPATPEK